MRFAAALTDGKTSPILNQVYVLFSEATYLLKFNVKAVKHVLFKI